MAILSKIRQRTLILILIIALALFAFILSDVLTKGGFNSGNPKNIGVVNGTDIDMLSFRQKVDNAQANLGPNATNTQAVRYVWDQEVGKILFEEQFEKLGLTVEKDEQWNIMMASLVNNPNFQNENGFFDEYRLREYIASIEKEGGEIWRQWLDYEKSLAANAIQQHFFNLVKGGFTATKLESKWAYHNERDLVDFNFVLIPYKAIADDKIEVSKEEILAYVKEHPKSFEEEASRGIRFVLFQEKASLEDENQVKEAVLSLLNDRVEYNSETQKNDTVKGLKNTTEISEFLAANSDLPYENTFVTKNQLPSNVADSILATPEGKIFGPYRDGAFFKATKVVAATVQPDSVKASHILVSYQGLQSAGLDALPKSEAKILVDSLLTVIKSNQIKFTELAPKYSIDQSNRDKGGDLGYFAHGTMVKPFNDYVFENKKGDIGIVETQFGYHIIKIDDQKGTVKVVKVANLARRIEPSDKTISDLFTTATKFELAVKEKDFQEVADQNKYQANPINSIHLLDELLPGIGSNRSLVQWTFEENTKIGDIKRFDLANGDYAVVQLTKKAEKGLMKPEDASIRVLPILRNQKKAAIIKEKIAKLNMDDAAKTYNVSIESALAVNRKNPMIAGAGREPEVVGAAFSLKPDQTSVALEGNNGVYKIKVIKLNKAEDIQSYLSYGDAILNQRSAPVSGNIFNALKAKAKIEDNRAVFY
ncbi:MAG: peptidylprolyl isomerase [Flavobacteriales bacterium CG_4_9_14_3_um_filter_40_17]|nr:MAG: peptidylprolyl isomerase [Flavobacteriales bacterium CG_4_9_14_3_um_filter_40_17]